MDQSLSETGTSEKTLSFLDSLGTLLFYTETPGGGRKAALGICIEDPTTVSI